MIYIIQKEEEPISSCESELESLFNSNSNSDNDNNENNSSSSIQNDNENYDNSNSNSHSKQYIMLFNLFKEQELKWFSNNDENIMPECAHNIDIGFDLKYPEKNAIKLELHSCICIDLKIALEILATTMVQLAFRIAQLVLVENREELEITAREIQGFRSMGRIDVLVNMAKEEIINKKEIISTCQSIFILPYDQYMLTIERKVKGQAQMFEAETTICETREIGFTNLYISAKSLKHIKISIYNTTGDVIEIPKGTIIEYLSTEVEDQPPSTILNFPQLCRYVDITLQTIYGQEKCYLLQLKQLEQMNLENLDLL
ncbi:hypothetical protein G9A89_003732 [Geosiphon pyriformis]|nr:hypothetical protein G9A89_003732 [Geosiphon pyriformis]